jgi:hypothetical protein
MLNLIPILVYAPVDASTEPSTARCQHFRPSGYFILSEA